MCESVRSVESVMRLVWAGCVVRRERVVPRVSGERFVGVCVCARAFLYT